MSLPLFEFAAADFANRDRQLANPPRWDANKVSPPAFPGPVYDETLDEVRLKGQQARIYLEMQDGVFRTLREIHNLTGDPEASISAQLRGFKKFGFKLNKQRRGDPSNGLWEYQLLVPKKPDPGKLFAN